MPAKNKRRPGLDIQHAFFVRVHAHLRAHGYCARAIALSQAGKSKAAEKVKREAKKWLRKMLAIEAVTSANRPQGGRREEL
jgi:hypothetical protein